MSQFAEMITAPQVDDPISFVADTFLPAVWQPKREALQFAKDAQAIPYTRPALIAEINGKIPHIRDRQYDVRIVVLYTVEWAITLEALGFEDITLVTKEIDPLLATEAAKYNYKYSTIEDIKHMKFDVVVGNPPYQAPDSKNAIYQRFYKEIINNMLIAGGYLAFITPTPMIKGLAGERVDKVPMPIMRNPILINVSNIKARYFQGVGSSFCYFVVQNSEYCGSTKVETETDTFDAPFSGVVPKSTNTQLAFSIWDKCFSGNNVYGCTTSDCSKKSPKRTGDQPVIRTINADGTHDTYSVELFNENHALLNSPKVMVTIMGRKKIIDYTHNLLGSAEHLMASVPTLSDAQSESLASLFDTKLETMHASLSAETKDFYYSFIRHLSVVPLDRIWTTEALYEHFNLTTEEIALIEETVG